MSQVLRNKLTDWVQEQVAGKRGGEQVLLSLDASVDGTDDGLTLAEVIADSATTESVNVMGGNRHDAAFDVARALDGLTPVQKRLCRMLGEEGLSVKEAAERLRIPRATMWRCGRSKVRREPASRKPFPPA